MWQTGDIPDIRRSTARKYRPKKTMKTIIQFWAVNGATSLFFRHYRSISRSFSTPTRLKTDDSYSNIPVLQIQCLDGNMQISNTNTPLILARFHRFSRRPFTLMIRFSANIVLFYDTQYYLSLEHKTLYIISSSFFLISFLNSYMAALIVRPILRYQPLYAYRVLRFFVHPELFLFIIMIKH